MEVSIELQPDAYSALRDLAGREGISPEELVSRIIRQWLEDQADYAAGAAVLERVRAGSEAIHTASAVKSIAGLD